MIRRGTMARAAVTWGWVLVCLCTAGIALSKDNSSVAEDPLVSMARMRLQERLQQMRPDITRIELTALGRPPKSSMKGAKTFVAVGLPPGTALSAHMCAWIEARVQGRSIGSVPVWFAVKAFRPVLVSQRSRAARDPVDAADFLVEERDVASLGQIPMNIATDVTHLRARRAISQGRILRREDVEELPQILRGQEVIVEVKYGSVAIETNAVALREARLGEAVSLQNPTSHLMYNARVVGDGRAAVLSP
jgi:flagella basal body P-ring formation protein FlgA